MIDMEIKPYERMVYYYETDRMGIVHHSNYIRWFEEARLDWMKQIGWDYKTIEDDNIIIPVLSVNHVQIWRQHCDLCKACRVHRHPYWIFL